MLVFSRFKKAVKVNQIETRLIGNFMLVNRLHGSWMSAMPGFPEGWFAITVTVAQRGLFLDSI